MIRASQILERFRLTTEEDVVTSVVPCSFIRHSGGTICTEPEHSPEQMRRRILQGTVQSLAKLFAYKNRRFEVVIPIAFADYQYDRDYFGDQDTSYVTVKGRWKENRGTGQRYINSVEMFGPRQATGGQARAKYRLEPDGGVMFVYVWAISNQMTAHIGQVLRRMVE